MVSSLPKAQWHRWKIGSCQPYSPCFCSLSPLPLVFSKTLAELKFFHQSLCTIPEICKLCTYRIFVCIISFYLRRNRLNLQQADALNRVPIFKFLKLKRKVWEEFELFVILDLHFLFVLALSLDWKMKKSRVNTMDKTPLEYCVQLVQLSVLVAPILWIHGYHEKLWIKLGRL